MKRLNNKGLTLVELVIAIGMSTIVIGAATLFLYNAEKSYRISQYSVDLQMESQILMEQLSNWVMESNRIEIADAGKALVLYRMPIAKLKYASGAEPTTDTELKYYRTIIYCRENKLYAKFDEASSSAEYDAEIELRGTADYECLRDGATLSEEDVIGDHVQFFDLYVPRGADPNNLNSVEIQISLKEGNQNTQAKSYIVSDVFSLRNVVYKAPVVATPEPTTSPEPTESPEPTDEP